MLEPLKKALCITAIITGIVFVLWGIGSLIVAGDSHSMTFHIAGFVVFKLVLGGGLIATGSCFFDYTPPFKYSNRNRDSSKDIPRFYKPVGQ